LAAKVLLELNLMSPLQKLILVFCLKAIGVSPVSRTTVKLQAFFRRYIMGDHETQKLLGVTERKLRHQ
jgi:hypothetical protein